MTSLLGYSDPRLNADTVFSTQKPRDYDNNQAYFIFPKWKQFSFDYGKFEVKFSDTITKFEKKAGEAAADSDGLCPPTWLVPRHPGARGFLPHPGMEVGGSLEGWCPRGQPWAQLGSFPSRRVGGSLDTSSCPHPHWGAHRPGRTPTALPCSIRPDPLRWVSRSASGRIQLNRAVKRNETYCERRTAIQK